jgi:hypothetical protein
MKRSYKIKKKELLAPYVAQSYKNIYENLNSLEIKLQR